MSRARAGEAARAISRAATDDSGAIVVTGLFACAFLIGALWYLLGIGDAILFKERMQDGADAVAFTPSVIHARGMNLIALIKGKGAKIAKAASAVDEAADAAKLAKLDEADAAKLGKGSKTGADAPTCVGGVCTGGNNCFAASTPVSTLGGDVPIDTLNESSRATRRRA